MGDTIAIEYVLGGALVFIIIVFGLAVRHCKNSEVCEED